MPENLRSPERQLIELRIEHADLDAMIDRLMEQAAEGKAVDELMLRRLKKRRLGLRDQMALIEREIDGKEPA